MNISCKIVQDLLPLYHDGVCSEESRKLVEVHLNECENCKRMLSEMDGEWVSPEASQDELKPLVSINETVKRGKRRALFKGVAIAMSVIVLLFGVVNVWWYFERYQFYQQFAEGHNLMLNLVNTDGNVIASEYEWEDEVYRYHVSVPAYLSTYHNVYMERLDNSYDKRVSLHIYRGMDGGKYTYGVSIYDEPVENKDWVSFILDQDMNLEYLAHWDEEMIAACNEAFVEHEAEIMEIIQDAKEMWEFLK